jgi:hypothetical protein
VEPSAVHGYPRLLSSSYPGRALLPPATGERSAVPGSRRRPRGGEEVVAPGVMRATTSSSFTGHERSDPRPPLVGGCGINGRRGQTRRAPRGPACSLRRASTSRRPSVAANLATRSHNAARGADGVGVGWLPESVTSCSGVPVGTGGRPGAFGRKAPGRVPVGLPRARPPATASQFVAPSGRRRMSRASKGQGDTSPFVSGGNRRVGTVHPQSDESPRRGIPSALAAPALSRT